MRRSPLRILQLCQIILRLPRLSFLFKRPIFLETLMFGSQRPHVLDDPVKKERRSWNRVPVQVGVFCQNVQGEDELCWSARVVDISRAGMKLSSPHRFHPPTPIPIPKPARPSETSPFSQ